MKGKSVQLPLPTFSPKETLALIFRLNPKQSFSLDRIKELLVAVGIDIPDLGNQLMSFKAQGMIKMLATKDGTVWRLNPRALGTPLLPDSSVPE